MKAGLITAFDRRTSTVRALPFPWTVGPGGAPQQITAGYGGKVPPTPLCIANFSDDLRRCAGSRVPPRLLFHEDFLSLYWDNNNTVMMCDTYWKAGATAGHPGDVSEITLDPAAGAGVLRFASGNPSLGSTACYMVKPPNPILSSAADALWMTALVKHEGPLANYALYGPGVQDSLGGVSNTGEQVAILTGTAYGANWNLWAQTYVPVHSSSVADTGVPIVLDQWVWIDLFYVPGSYAAMWVDGQGPVFVYTVPSDTQGLAPYAYYINWAAGPTIHMSMDSITVRAIFSKGLPHPDMLPL